MAQFKKGDRVKKVRLEYGEGVMATIGKEGVLVRDPEGIGSGGNIYIDSFGGGQSCAGFGDEFELIEEEYQPITPKVGEKYLMKKKLPKAMHANEGFVTRVVEVDTGYTECTDSEGCNVCIDTSLLTTEYLELVEEEPEPIFETKDIQFYSRSVDWPETDKCVWVESQINKEPKQTIMQKLTSALKKALSKDLQVLYKAGRINGGLELSSEGRREYTNALFQNTGDHKAAVAEMVETAKEELKEDEA